ncbi:MAG: glycosyl hydrolase [Bacillota bacterium]
MRKAVILAVVLTMLLTAVLSQTVISVAETSASIYEAEDGILTGTVKSTSSPGYSGSGYVTGFDTDGDSVTINVNIAAAGLYSLSVRYNAPYGSKVCSLVVNNTPAGEVSLKETTGFIEIPANKVYLNSGSNSIKIDKNWGWYEIDYIRIQEASISAPHQVTKALVNPNATYEAKALMSYLVDTYGKKNISGQQEISNLSWYDSNIGKKPALMGFDMMDYSPSRVEFRTSSTEAEKAIEWWTKNKGIVTFCWHWNAPKDLINQAPDKMWWSGFYTRATTFDIAYAMNNPGSLDYQLLIRDIDAIAVQLKKLQAANVPVLWRPLHEAGGGWFWWGAKGAEPCKKLYILMYERLTNHHKLNNLIWVWSTPEADWYPGDQYVDIIGYDSYPGAFNYNPVIGRYDGLVSIVGDKKIVALTENGPIPDPENLIGYGAHWSWFCTWHGFQTQENSLDHMKKVFNHDYVITLDELPDLKTYPVGDVTPQPTPPVTAGDLNGDGNIDSTDYTLLKRYIIKIILGLPVKDKIGAADLNRDGEINSTDLTILKRYILKIISKIPI